MEKMFSARYRQQEILRRQPPLHTLGAVPAALRRARLSVRIWYSVLCCLFFVYLSPSVFFYVLFGRLLVGTSFEDCDRTASAKFFSWVLMRLRRSYCFSCGFEGSAYYYELKTQFSDLGVFNYQIPDYFFESME